VIYSRLDYTTAKPKCWEKIRFFSSGPASDIRTCEENRSAFLRNGGGQNQSEAEIAQLTASKYLGNARATGGPGILPVTNWVQRF
jgi:hypothetical protein